MPKFLEEKLKKDAEKKGLSPKAATGRAFAIMNSIGAVKGNKETAKGKAMEKKHAKDVKVGRTK